MWRPKKGWINPYKKGITSSDQIRENAYEAGADAILEALRDGGIFTYGNHTPDIDLDDAPDESGYWVFIPEENQ